jgi:hypothetical protein
MVSNQKMNIDVISQWVSIERLHPIRRVNVVCSFKIRGKATKLEAAVYILNTGCFSQLPSKSGDGYSVESSVNQ